MIASALTKRAAKVIAIEPEPHTAAKLRANTAKYDNVEVLERDFMELTLPDYPYKVFANIPFHLSSEILRKLTESQNAPESIYLIVQKQFARKIVPSSNHFTSQLGVVISPVYSARIRRPLKKTDFFPHPNVDTVFLELKRRQEPLLPAGEMIKFRAFVKECFSARHFFIATTKNASNLPPQTKPSELLPEQWISLFKQPAK